MGVVAALSNTQNFFPMEVITQTGALATASLIISLFIALLISDSKYWNKWTSSTLEGSSYPLLITFVFIVVYKAMLIL